jgi:DNA-binding transcriptional LysR family regulator
VLHCSQATVSRRLAQLEALVGVSPFERVSVGMKLSVTGEQLLPYAETALAAVRDGLDAVSSLREPP